VTAEAALRESEQLSRLLVERAREYAIVLLDTQGCIRTWNSGARRLFAYLEEEVTGKPHAVIYTPEDQSAGIPEAELESATVDGSISDDRWYVRKDGVRLWASGVTQQLRDEEGVLKGYFKVLRDNTERKRMEETLRKWNESLEERVRERTSALGEREREIRALGLQLAMAEANERDRIALVLHDDLQQRLYSMQVIIALMRRSVEAREMDEVGKLTTELGTRLSEAVTSVSGLSSDLSLHCAEAATLAEAVRQLAERMQANHRLEVDVTSATTIPEPSLEVRTVLLQGVQELLFNVVKHSGASRAAIDLAQDGSALVVRVRDQGDGFDPSAGSRPRGLGLPRVQHQVSLMHGEVEIDSTAGEGTTITVRIPTSPEDPLRRGLSP
jgi:two-component system CheB/CheR fusion protein